MRRPSKPTPPGISDLCFNPKSGRYVITERGITYHMDMEHTRNLKEYFKGIAVRGYQTTISGWYSKLDKITRKEVFRTGNIPASSVDFYPDQSFEE